MKGLRLLLIGPPGGGKGTVGKYMQKDYGLPVYSTGDILRDEIARGTKEGLEAQAIIKRGELVPNSVMVGLLRKTLAQNKDGRWILDGYPRSLEQASSLDALLSELRQPLHAIFSLEVPRDVILPRVSGRMVHPASGRVYNEHFQPPKQPWKDDVTGEPLVRRPDDEPAVVNSRLDLFDKQTQPVLAHYTSKSSQIVHKIKCNTSPEGYEKIKPILAKLAQ